MTRKERVQKKTQKSGLISYYHNSIKGHYKELKYKELYTVITGVIVNNVLRLPYAVSGANSFKGVHGV